MSTAAGKDRLIFKTAALARSAPNAWREFLDEFETYANETKNECVQAPLERLQVAQGRAQTCAELAKLFRDAVTSADRKLSRAG